jgi:hypothetical protein
VKRFVSRETHRWLLFGIFALKAFFPSWGDYREERFEEDQRGFTTGAESKQSLRIQLLGFYS